MGKLRDTYNELGIPRNEKKAVEAARSAEMQGAWIDGEKGICSPKGDKVGKYLTALVHVLNTRKVSQRQMQMLAGGLVYLFSFRRPLMANLNDVWGFITGFDNDRQYKPLPLPVAQELWASFFLSVFSYMDFRLPTDPIVTASDASETGGGLVASTGLTEWGSRVAEGTVRGEEIESFQNQGLLVISAFDGIGSLRIALDTLKVPLAGYVSIEKDPIARRVLESHFPCSMQIIDIESVTPETLQQIAAQFPNCKAVLFGGGPPCQGVSQLNAARQGAIKDPRSSLHQVFDRIKGWLPEIFPWCPIYFLMESVSSMSDSDREIYTKSSGVLPYKVDACHLSLCRRPRLWWFNWVIPTGEGIEIFPPLSSSASDWGEIRFHYDCQSKDFLRPGRKPAGVGAFSTFTTAQPSKVPRYKPAGIQQATPKDLSACHQDRLRFPPYAYRWENGVIHERKGWRMLDINEKEAIMGFPIDYTFQSHPKGFRKANPLEANDARMTLIGNAWHVGVVCNLLQPLVASLGLTPAATVSQIMNQCKPGGAPEVSGLLLRPRIKGSIPFKSIEQKPKHQLLLVRKLLHLVSPKGADVLLSNPTEGLPQYHRLRNSLSPKLWHWKVVTGWTWKANGGTVCEHINRLEMRAIDTSLRWRILKHKGFRTKILHLVDSLVSLQIITKGRTSSRKLRSICKRIAGFQLIGGVLLTLGYTASKINPADAPSRRSRKRKWGDVK